MRLFGLIVFLFLLAAFGIGAGLSESEILTPDNITQVIDNTNITQIELSRVSISEEGFIGTNNIITILESYIRFVLTFSLEILKVGIGFGYDNPDYFEPAFILKIISWIVILVIISLLIKPVTYAIVLLILLGIWIKDKVKSNFIKRTKK